MALATSDLCQVEPEEIYVPYKSTPNGMIWLKDTRDGLVPVPLTNFTAEIVEDILIDDGTEHWRSFKIRTVMGHHHMTFEVPALRFNQMQWPTEHLGAEAFLYPGPAIREHARAAVQCLSKNIIKRNIYGHLGWRLLEEKQWFYLHTAGAIGQHGSADSVTVQINDALSCYALVNPAIDGLAPAVEASLKFLALAPRITAFPLYGAIWRAVLAEGDFSLHVVGPTGEGKSAMAALLQQHFGPQMDARHLPANWTSTANSLEAVAFEAKDSLLVVDEFTPTDSAHANTIQRTAERLLRAQANRTGRGRLRSDTTYRSTKPPRGLILSTGEDIPSGHSLRARMLIIEIEPKSVDFEILTQCQKDAADGLYAQALCGFIKWLAPKYDEIHQQWSEELAEIRYFAAQGVMHRRTPENIASLALGWRYFLLFAIDAGVFTTTEAERYWSHVWETLGQLALVQGQYQSGAEPTRRFLELLGNAIASGKAHLKSIRPYDYHSILKFFELKYNAH